MFELISSHKVVTNCETMHFTLLWLSNLGKLAVGEPDLLIETLVYKAKFTTLNSQ